MREWNEKEWRKHTHTHGAIQYRNVWWWRWQTMNWWNIRNIKMDWLMLIAEYGIEKRWHFWWLFSNRAMCWCVFVCIFLLASQNLVFILFFRLCFFFVLVQSIITNSPFVCFGHFIYYWNGYSNAFLFLFLLLLILSQPPRAWLLLKSMSMNGT